MALLPGEEIGLETYPDNDQFFRFEHGEGKVFINDTEYHVSDGDDVILLAGARHNILYSSTLEPLQMYMLYTPSPSVRWHRSTSQG